jgi:hypothetical protein
MDLPSNTITIIYWIVNNMSVWSFHEKYDNSVIR